MTLSVQSVFEECRIPTHPHVFVIGHRATQATVFAQQLRALNLVWALATEGGEGSLSGKQVVVVGGGIAGLTAAAAAALNGAHVTVLERHDELLHLQRGCHTRYLHPRVFDWPEPDARWASAGLPILNWSVGSAGCVADQILADYHRIRLSSDNGVREHTAVRDVRLANAVRDVSWRGREGQESVPATFVILALGFGIERTVNHLPRRSYWRVDSLTQTALDSEDDRYRILVAGTGDGGIIDVLRAKLKEFDHAGFLDECVLRLERDELKRKIVEIEQSAREEVRWQRAAGRDESRIEAVVASMLADAYAQLSELEELDELLSVIRPETDLIWIGRLPVPCSPFSQPLNRILGWRAYACRIVDYRQAALQEVQLRDQTAARGFRYDAVLALDDGSSL